MIIVTMDRVTGMKLSVIPGLLSVHIVFGLIFLRFNYIIKFLIGLIVGALIYLVAGKVMPYELISTHWDIYGYWDLTITNWILGMILWEATFLTIKMIENQKRIKNGANTCRCCTTFNI
jgi:hypothetical protein